MNEANLRERTKKLLEVNKIIKRLDVSIRPGAFSLLQGYIISETAPSKEHRGKNKPPHDQVEDPASFFSKHNHEKPSENGLLLSAYHYSQFGTSAFTIEEMEELANGVGVTIPERLDMTFLQAKRDGKKLFLRAGRGAFKPTVHGETFFKKTYEVLKGTRQKTQGAEQG